MRPAERSCASSGAMRRGQTEGLTRSARMWEVQDDGSGPRGRGFASGYVEQDQAGSRAVPRRGLAERGLIVTKYTVIYQRDESGAWIARVRGVPEAHSYGRTLEQARERIREALSL